MPKNTNNKKKSRFSTIIISSLAYLVLGFIMVIFPSTIGTALCLILGIALTVYGLFNTISFFISRESNLYVELIIGVLSTAFGVFTLISPDIIKNIVFSIIGIVIIIDSLMDIKHAFQLKALGMKFWWIYLIISTLVIILGICTIFFQSFFAQMLMILLGLMMIYEGISGFTIIALIGHYAKKSTINRKMIDVKAEDK